MNKNIPWKLIISDLKNEITEQETSLLNEWRTKDENNALYLEFASLWQEIQKDSGSYHPDAEYYWKQLQAKINSREKIEVKRAISLRTFRTAAAVAVVFLIVSVFASYFIGSSISRPAQRSQTYTAINGKSQMILPDGSSVWLNIGSSLTYETTFLNERTVKLDGEALFDVKKDAKHPFVVDLNNIQVKVKGTRFNVQAYPANPDIRVALLEGTVCIISGREEQEMSPGEIASFNRASNLLSIAKDDVDFESFWAKKSYFFNARPLGYICKYLERWYHVEISLDPAIAESYVYTFTITDEPLETVLQIMSRINPIQYSFEENNEVIIKYAESHKNDSFN